MNMYNKNFFSNNVKEDNSIIEKASKQKYFNVIISKNGSESQKGIWAIDIAEAREKAYWKWIEADKREVTETN